MIGMAMGKNYETDIVIFAYIEYFISVFVCCRIYQNGISVFRKKVTVDAAAFYNF